MKRGIAIKTRGEKAQRAMSCAGEGEGRINK
jgi:hypothetical protein